jgi:drug/metabolite transporter (DMT)-like permease
MSGAEAGRNWKLGLSLALATAVMWGLLPIIVKGAVHDFDPLTATWFRFAGATALFGLWLSWRRPESLIPRFKGKAAWLLPLAILGMSGNFSLYAVSLKYQSPSVTQTLMQLAPPTIFLGGAFLFKEGVCKLQWVGILVMIPGMALFFNSRLPEIFGGSHESAFGAFLTVLSAFSFATYSLCQKGLFPEIRPESTLFMAVLCGTFILLPFSDFSQVWKASPTGLALMLLAVLNTIFAFVAFGEAMRVWDASRVGAVVALPPLVAVACTGSSRSSYRFHPSEGLN